MCADLSGVDSRQIKVVFENGVPTITGKRAEEKKSEHEGYRRIERSHGSFQRSFRMPDSIVSDNIFAKSDKGVLEVRIPKRDKAQRRIKI